MYFLKSFQHSLLQLQLHTHLHSGQSEQEDSGVDFIGVGGQVVGDLGLEVVCRGGGWVVGVSRLLHDVSFNAVVAVVSLSVGLSVKIASFRNDMDWGFFIIPVMLSCGVVHILVNRLPWKRITK